METNQPIINEYEKTILAQNLILIQGSNELKYTSEEIKMFNELSENVNIFYPRNKNEKINQEKLLKDIKKINEYILKYENQISIILFNSKPISETVKLKMQKQFQRIEKLANLIYSKYEELDI
ncbi:MAG: hypothetical protein RBT49_17025 [Bacteroidales bacterium]|jgi:hypothetical protein|nr:hypothetical protein [Bacteroidales bacterium]